MALLAEAVSRGCRARIRSAMPKTPAAAPAGDEKDEKKAPGGQNEEEQTTRALIRAALGIDPVSAVLPQPDNVPELTAVEHASFYDEKKAARTSGQFFVPKDQK